MRRSFFLRALAHRRYVDILEHQGDQLFGRVAFSLSRIETELINHPKEPGSGEDLLLHGLQLRIEVGGAIGDHVTLGHLLRDNDESGFRGIPVGQHPDGDDRANGDGAGGEQDQPAPASEHPADLVQGFAEITFFFEFRQGSSSARAR